MSLRQQFDEIFNSHINGNGRQLVQQFDELNGDEKAEFISYMRDELGRADEVIDLLRRYFLVKGD